ncbi:MAG: LysM peptidoglycan-binding domain-containing protein [Patescibacteria group bacterium]|nr:LysM peptidoglycan-binding domain-containing protein [Patescibacteria group bacterium]
MTINELKKKLNSTESIVSLVLGIVVVVTAGILLLNFVRNRPNTAKTENAEQTLSVVPGAPVGEKVTVSLPATHKVVSGENLWSIAERYYKSGYNWVTLAKANNLSNPDLLSIDRELTVPKADPIYPSGSVNGNGASVEAITSGKYKVVKGDDLWSISCRAYADCYKWTQIASANKLANADLIDVGQELVLPR